MVVKAPNPVEDERTPLAQAEVERPADDQLVVARVVDDLESALDPRQRAVDDRGPALPTCQATPANLSPPETANARQSSSWSSPKMLTQKAPAFAMRGQLVDDLAGAKGDQRRVE